MPSAPNARHTPAAALAFGSRLLWVMLASSFLTSAAISFAQPPLINPTLPPNAAQPSAQGVPVPNRGPAPARPPVAGAQPPAAAPAGAAAAPAGAAASQKGREKPEMKMQSLELVTKDNVTLRAFYFPSDRGKEAIPVIIVHEWQGQASPYIGLVKALWEAGCAVIVPEFRGHGGSREYFVGERKVEFDIARMGRADVANIINGDMEAVKKFLRGENNAGKLNLNALALVGIREGGIVAAHWAVKDLNFPSVGAMKQGQDVKAIVLVSPEKILKGFSLDETLQDNLLWQLPFLIVAGQTSPQFADADRLSKRLGIRKKKATGGTAVGLQVETVNTSLSGPALLNDAPGVTEKVVTFIKTQLVDRSAKIPWIERQQ